MSKEKKVAPEIEVLASQIEMVPIDSIYPYEQNCKMHSKPQVSKVASSIAQYGWDQPIVTDKDRVIIKGHGRWLAAKMLNLDEVPVIVNTTLSEADARLSRIADNKVAESEYDTAALWAEMEEIKEQGFTFDKLGFDAKQIRGMFPDLAKSVGVNDPGDAKLIQAPNSDGSYDPTLPREEGFIGAFVGEDAWLRKLSMVDYLNHHDQILVGFSSGKDSLAALCWCLENCDRDKIVAYYANPGWGVDWPHSIEYIKYVEKKLGITVLRAGHNDTTPFLNLLLQRGYMGHGNCYVQSGVKVPAINTLFEKNNWLSRKGANVVQIIGIRWEESSSRAKIYPDRGFLKDTGNHYASPVIAWTDYDVIKYIEERGFKLHTAYEGEPRMGCLVCHQGAAEGSIIVRKKFPKLFRTLMEFHGIGARKRGVVNMDTINKMMASTRDSGIDASKFSGMYQNIALTTRQMEQELIALGAITEADLPYLAEPFDAKKHIYQTDGYELKDRTTMYKSYYEAADNAVSDEEAFLSDDHDGACATEEELF